MERSGAGDPARTLALLWGVPVDGGRRGPRPGLDVDAVTTAAIALADASGLAAVTMRRLAGELGVAPMTLYTYVPGRAELLDLALDAVYRDATRTDTTGRPWRERVAAVAEENRALVLAHPWVAEVATARPVLGPGQMAKYEHELAAFDDTGLDDTDTDAALTFVVDVAVAAARAEQAARSATGTDAAWWEANAPLLERVLDPAAYPRAVRVGTAAGTANDSARDPDRAWHFGLERLLDGLAGLVAGR